jgi:hypothetical protein
MNQLLSDHLVNLKSALLLLQATGEQGFEGLIAAALHEITGVPFRLASNGRQFGIDGKHAYDADSICFEGKRYDGKIPREKVITKIADLARSGSHPDLVWVLGATTSVDTQLADDVRNDGREKGISVLILDWSTAYLPPLAVALAMGCQRVQEFLKANIGDNNGWRNALLALEAVKVDGDFNEHAKRIKAELDVPAVSTAIAREANVRWLTEGFTDRRRARNQFGQPLSPGDSASAKTLPRRILTDQLQPFLAEPPGGKVVFVLGGEGCGKSWIIAQSWLALDPKPLMIIFSPDEFQEKAAQNDIEELLITKLIRQTGDELTEVNRKRWNRRLSHWKENPNAGCPRLIVTIDDINQNPSADWGRIINKVGEQLEQIGGSLIVTSRAPYFRDHVKRRLNVSTIEINVPEWMPAERDEILRHHSINPAALHSAVAQSLLNPRLLGIAVELLKNDDITALEELSVSRLLFEHLRASEQDAPIPQSVDVFVRRLRDHAQKILERVQQKQEDDLNIFETDTPAVADGRFFFSVEGEPGKYQLKNDGLTLALGFSVVDRLRSAKRNHRDLNGTLTALLEPITALDDTSDVVLAALTVTVTVTVADDQYMQDVAAALVKGFASLQNLDQTKFPAFVGLSKSRPLVFMEAAHDLCLADVYIQNFDWIKFAIIEASKNTRTWQEIANETRRWLSLYSLLPGRIENQQTIGETLNALSSGERKILERLRRQDSDLYALTRLGLFVLAGKPLAPFAECLVNWRFSIALNSNYTTPYKDLTHLISLNRVDWRETRTALLKACEPLRDNNVSPAGKWALVAILRATGDAGDDEEAQTLATELTKDRPRFPNWKLIEDYCATDSCDPASTEPDNIGQTAERYGAIDVSKLRLVMGQTSEDLFFVDARLGMARFRPVQAVAKHRELAENILTRSGFPLRQGLFELRKHNVLLTSTQAHTLVSRWREIKSDDTLSNLTKQDSWIVSQYHLLLAFPLLSAKEQTEILLSIKEGEPILLDLFNSMSPLDESSFERLFVEARKNQDEYRQYLLLMMAKSTGTSISVETRSIIASLASSDSERLRTVACGVIAQYGDNNMSAVAAQSSLNAANICTVGIESDAMAVWASGRSPVRDEQRVIRLDQAETDHNLSLEVLAGLINGQQEFLVQYINEKLMSEEPAEIARGIMVAGFSDVSEFNSEVLSRYENSAGLIGLAYKAAKYAYERNCWARHWFEQMSKAVEPSDFWRSSVLFNKIIDGRFVVWVDEYPKVGTPIVTYELNMREHLKNRYKRWEEHRKKKLFGNDAPDKIFLLGAE